MSAAVSMPAVTTTAPTPEQEARAVLRAAIEICLANERACLDEAEDLADLGMEIAMQAGARAALAEKWRWKGIEYARELAERIEGST